MRRTLVTIVLPDGRSFPARTDLHGRGPVRPGEEFTAREVWPDTPRFKKGGRRYRVRVVRVARHGFYPSLIHVEILQVFA